MVEHTIENLRLAIKNMGSTREFAALTGMSDSSVYQMLRYGGTRGVSSEAQARIWRAVDQVLEGTIPERTPVVHKKETPKEPQQKVERTPVVPRRQTPTPADASNVIDAVRNEARVYRVQQSLAERVLRLGLEMVELEKENTALKVENDALARIFGR